MDILQNYATKGSESRQSSALLTPSTNIPDSTGASNATSTADDRMTVAYLLQSEWSIWSTYGSVTFIDLRSEIKLLSDWNIVFLIESHEFCHDVSLNTFIHPALLLINQIAFAISKTRDIAEWSSSGPSSSQWVLQWSITWCTQR